MRCGAPSRGLSRLHWALVAKVRVGLLGICGSQGSRSGAKGQRRDRGMASVEVALALPVVVTLLAVCVGAVSLGVDRVRCVDAARLAARALARGDDSGTALALARTAAPPGAAVAVSSSADRVTVTVTSVRSVGWLCRFEGAGRATGQREASGAADP